jgi:hypothetical protein
MVPYFLEVFVGLSFNDVITLERRRSKPKTKFIMFINHEKNNIKQSKYYIYISVLKIVSTLEFISSDQQYIDINKLCDIVLMVIFIILYLYECNIIIDTYNITQMNKDKIIEYITHISHNLRIYKHRIGKSKDWETIWYDKLFEKYIIYIYYNDMTESVNTNSEIYTILTPQKYTELNIPSSATLLSKFMPSIPSISSIFKRE